jgi:EmrB/QacA subfamily drug resistance transporter
MLVVLAVLCAAQFMVVLDVTVVNVALPSIQSDLGIAFATLPWVVTAYTLAFGGVLLLGGRAADLFGRRRVFVAGLVVFTAASLASGLATSTAMLLATRGLQGLGAAMLSPAALSLLTELFPEGAARRRALAIWGAVGAGGAAVGVLVGGALIAAFDWRAVFLVNVPVGITLLLVAPRLLPARSLSNISRSADIAGALTLTASLVALLYGLLGATGAGWTSSQTLGLLAGAAVGLTVFVAIEARTGAPLVPLRVFARRPTVSALVLMMVSMGTLVSVFFFCSLYLQHVLGHSALRTGLEFLPMATLTVIAAQVGGHFIVHFGVKRVLAGGLALSAIGTFLLSRLPQHGSYLADVLPGFLLIALGVGLALVGILVTALAGSTAEDAGLASGLTNTAHELGIALILSLLSTIAASKVGGASLLVSGHPGQLVSGIHDALRVAAALTLAGSLFALATLRRNDIPAGAEAAYSLH